MLNLTLEQAARLMGKSSHSHRIVKGASVDSRLTQSGDLFFALPGNRVDGHQFLADAVAKGAVGAVVSDSYHGDSYGMPLIHANDCLKALQDLAKAILQQQNPRVVAVTGSVGKTTTKEMIATILKQKYRTTASPGNSNSQTGLPLVILNAMKGDEEVLVLEMGMTHPGNILNLIEVAAPEIAVITNVSLVHAENFDSLAEIARAKGEILTHPATRIGVVNRDIETFDELMHTGPCRKLSFSVASMESDYYLRENNGHLEIRGVAGDHADIELLTIPGRHNRHNFLAAAVVGRAFDVSWDEIKTASRNFTLPERRLEHVEKHGILFINDSYNAPFIAIKAALEEMPSPKPGCKRVAVLGEMRELGKYSEGLHREIGKFSLDYVDMMFCFGKDCKPICEEWHRQGRGADLFLERTDLVAALRKVVNPGDVVLLKGAKSKELWKVLEEI